MFISFFFLETGTSLVWLHHITQLQRPMEKICDCCICTAGFQISNWGTCGQINQDNLCSVCLVCVQAVIYVNLIRSTEKVACSDPVVVIYVHCLHKCCLGVSTTHPWWRLGRTEIHLYEGTSEKYKKKLHPLHRCWAKFVGAGCLISISFT